MNHPEDEVPLAQVPGTKGWVENYLSQAYCPAAGIGFFLHIGGMYFDPKLWDELTVVYLPGDEFLVARSFAYGDVEAQARGPVGPALRYTCEEPFATWRKTFRGAVRRVSGVELRSGAVGDGAHVPLEFELVYRAMGPVFELGDMAEQNWAAQHYEQHCTVSGHIVVDGRTIELDGTGIRDHSRGTRDLTSLQNHLWAHGEWSDGRRFCLMYIGNQDGTGRMNHAVFSDGTTVRAGSLVSPPPLLDEWRDHPGDYEMVFDVEGEKVHIAAHVHQVAGLTIAGPGEVALGANPGPELNHHLLSEAMTRFEWDGASGYGLSERSVKLS
jgi:hypothetical protein